MRNSAGIFRALPLPPPKKKKEEKKNSTCNPFFFKMICRWQETPFAAVFWKPIFFNINHQTQPYMTKTQNLSVMIASLCILMSGCATGGNGENPVTAWQQERSCAKQIAEANAQARPLTLSDVTCKSTVENAVLAAPINTFASASAALYLQVVKGVDQMAATQDGRLIYEGVQNDIKAGASFESLLAKMTPEQKAAYQKYENAVKQADQEEVMNDVVLPLIKQIAAEIEKVANLANDLQRNPEFAKLSGFDAISAGKAIANDASEISGQLGDAATGAQLWLELLKKDREAKQYMQNYSVE